MSLTTGTLAGYVLDAFTANTWTIIPGSRPSEVTVYMERNKGLELWKNIGRRGAPVSLTLGEVQYDNVFIVSPAPGVDEDSIGFKVLDMRWLWPRARIVKHFNVRKRTGDKRLVGDGRLENQQAVDDIAYKAYSLRDSIFVNSVEDVLKYVLGVFNARFGHDFILPPGIAQREFPIESMRIDAQGDQAIEQVLGLLGGLSIAPLPSGVLTIVDPNDGSEEQILADREAPFRGSSTIELIDKSILRPSGFRVLIENELELRMDGKEDDQEADRILAESKVKGQAMPNLILENVIQVPDIFVTSRGVKYGQGSWLSFERYLDAIKNEARPSQNTLGPVTYDIIRRYYLAPWVTKAQYEISASGDPDPVWVSRWRAIRKYFRVAWRPIKPWRDRFRRVTPWRVGIWDTENGERAPASIYCDYTAYPARRLLLHKAKSHRVEHGFINNFYGEKLLNARQAPIDFTLIDPDNAIFRFYLVTGHFGDETRLIPGAPAGLSTIKPTASSVFGLLKSLPPLAGGYNVASVFTVLMGGDNFHTEFEVKAEEVSALLGQDVGESRGPIWDLKIEPSPVTTARYAWKDERGEEIKRAFLTPFDPDGKRNQIPPELLVNRKHCVNMARAASAVVMSRFLDRHEGREVGPLNPKAVVGGAISSVSHTVSGGKDTTGRTLVSLEAPVTPRQFYSLLPIETQQEIRGIVL